MPESSLKCPYCGVAVEPDDTVCSNCFWDLRQAQQSPPPQKTMATQKAPELQMEEPDPPADVPDVSAPYSEEQEAADAAPATPPPGKADTKGKSDRKLAQPDRGTHERKKDPTHRERRPKPATRPAGEGTARPSSGTASGSSSDERAVAYRPRLRPPMAVLSVYDDDGKNAETFRIRQPEVTIGRSDGDVVIPHERMMSGRHAQITCRLVDGQYRWYLTDLDSTNGTYVRIGAGKLKSNTEMLLGAFRYRFDAAQQGTGTSELPETESLDQPARTLGWKKVSAEDLTRTSAFLVRLLPEGEDQKFLLPEIDQVLGSDRTSCDVCIEDDPMLSAAHARVYQDEHQRWHIEDMQSRNGIWLAVKEKPLDMSAQFQLGEQRFSIRFP